MTDWAAFAGFTGVVLAALLSLAHLSRGIPGSDDAGDPDGGRFDPRLVDWDIDSRTRPADDDPPGAGVPDDVDDPADEDSTPAASECDAVTAEAAAGEATARLAPERTAEPMEPVESPAAPRTRPRRPDAVDGSADDLPPHLLLVNVAASQALLGGFLALGAWYARVPPAALGLSRGALSTELLVGVALGVGLYAFNKAGSSLSRRFGLLPDESLRESLTPESAGGWALLFAVALPLIAGFEELLFRGALVGAVAAGFGVSPWFMASASSVAFGLGHGAQGRLGVVVTGLLGFVLASAFVLTGSLLVVVVAHYLVNALEFVGHELFEW